MAKWGMSRASRRSWTEGILTILAMICSLLFTTRAVGAGGLMREPLLQRVPCPDRKLGLLEQQCENRLHHAPP